MSRSQVFAIAAVLSAATLANAQLSAIKPVAPKQAKSSTPPKVEASTQVTKPTGEPTLGGPIVTNADTALTIIQRDLEGKVKRMPISPAEAAVKLLKLDAPTRARVNGVLIEHAAAWDGFMKANLKDVLRIAQGLQAAADNRALQPEAPGSAQTSDAIQVPRKGQQVFTPSGAGSEQAKLLEELRSLMIATPKSALSATSDEATLSDQVTGNEPPAAKPAQSLRARGTIGSQLAAVLSPEEAAAMQALVKQYIDARIADRMGEAKAAGRELRPAEAISREMLDALGGEFKRSYERTVGQAGKNLDTTINTLQLSLEQESKFRQIAGDSFQKTYGNTSAQERSRVFLEIYQILSPEQRELLIKQIR